jgi:hypothetical protein
VDGFAARAGGTVAVSGGGAVDATAGGGIGGGRSPRASHQTARPTSTSANPTLPSEDFFFTGAPLGPYHGSGRGRGRRQPPASAGSVKPPSRSHGNGTTRTTASGASGP